MGFAIGTQKEKLQEKERKGTYHKVAVGCWFTASGRGIPQLLKYEDENGVLKMLRNIRVIKEDKKYYAGVEHYCYQCCAVVEDTEYQFMLLYYPEENKWNMVLKNSTE